MGNNIKNILQGLFNKRRAIPRLISFLVWIAMIIMWWVIISLTIDMPMEYKLRHSTDGLRSEYLLMSERYDSLNNVLDNVVRRDENVFRKLFESNPYDLTADLEKERIALYEQLMDMDNDELSRMLDKHMQLALKEESKVLESYNDLKYSVSNNIQSIDYIPAIQPVNNRQLTLLAAGKKPLINPFHRAMREHHGVDYLVPEGTPVFATADGVIKSLSEKNTSHGKAVTISHENGYETSYSHLLDIRVKKGQRVKRGDIIALSGNSGLSFAPHLHYEVYRDTLIMDPVHYMFESVTPDEYVNMLIMSASTGQSLD
jgi:murein DD-endopeptidase MepM/ murein hydrolase activator NlpD